MPRRVAHSACITCRANRGELAAPGGVIYEDRNWRLEHCLRPIPLAGWLILKPKRHVTSFADLRTAEVKTLGPLLRATAVALARAAHVERVYLGLFAEEVAHIHIHVIPRPRRLAKVLRGPAIFRLFSRTHGGRDAASVRKAERVAEQVRRALRD